MVLVVVVVEVVVVDVVEVVVVDVGQDSLAGEQLLCIVSPSTHVSGG